MPPSGPAARCAGRSGTRPRAARHTPCYATGYAFREKTLLALFAFRADSRARHRDLRRDRPVHRGAARGGDHLRAAARADVPADRMPALAPQPGRDAAAGRGGDLLPGAAEPGRMDVRVEDSGHIARSAVDRRSAAPPGGPDPGFDRLRPVARGEHLAVRFADSQAGAAGGGRHPQFFGQRGRPAVRALFHADRRPAHGDLRARSAPFQQFGRTQRHARNPQDRPLQRHHHSAAGAHAGRPIWASTATGGWRSGCCSTVCSSSRRWTT